MARVSTTKIQTRCASLLLSLAPRTVDAAAQRANAPGMPRLIWRETHMKNSFPIFTLMALVLGTGAFADDSVARARSLKKQIEQQQSALGELKTQIRVARR